MPSPPSPQNWWIVRGGRQMLSPGFSATREPERIVRATPSTASCNVPPAGLPSGSEAVSYNTIKPLPRLMMSSRLLR